MPRRDEKQARLKDPAIYSLIGAGKLEQKRNKKWSRA